MIDFKQFHLFPSWYTQRLLHLSRHTEVCHEISAVSSVLRRTRHPDSRGAEPRLDLGNIYRGEQQSGAWSRLWFLQEKTKCLCPNGPGAETTLESEREEVAEQKEKNGHEVPQQNQSRAELEDQPLQTGKERPAGGERDTRDKTQKRKRF